MKRETGITLLATFLVLVTSAMKTYGDISTGEAWIALLLIGNLQSSLY